MAVFELPLNGLSDNGIGQPTGLVGPDGEPLRKDVGTATQPRTGYDGFAVPHALQFSTSYGSPRGYWRDRWDEALKHSREDALTMETDLGIMGMLQERQLAFATLPWHIHVPNEQDPAQAMVKQHITKVLESLVGPEESLMKLRLSLSWALWFGRQAAQVVWQWCRLAGVRTLTLADWLPTRGDKVSHMKDGTPAVDIYAGAATSYEFPEGDIALTTNGARALVLNGDMTWGWRMRYILHCHEQIDSDFFDAQAAEAVFGVGIRSRIYYLNWVDKEWLARTCDWVDQVGLGVNLWYYEASNAAARTQAQKAAKEMSDRTNILVPRWGQDKLPAFERVEVSGTGAELLLKLRQDIREQMRLYINGQVMSTGGTKGEGGDMGGSHRAQFATDTKTQVRNFDARNLDATLTGSMKCPGLVSMIQYHTFPETWPGPNNPEGFRASFVSELEDKESKERLEAIKAVWEMGVDVKADDLRSAAGIGKPTEGDEIIAGQQAPAPGEGEVGPDGEPLPGQEQEQPFPQPSMNARAEHYAGQHSPAGGVTIGGKFFPGGEFIPGDMVARATPEEKAKLGKPRAAKPAAAPTAAPKKKAGAPAAHPGSEHGSSVKVRPVKDRVFLGAPVPTKMTLTKQETGRVGEAVAVAYLRDVMGRKDARPMNTAKTNFPVDMIEDHAPTEVKAGLVSNGTGAQQWRLTFSKESAAEKAAYETMTPEERTAWNEDKQRRIHDRKAKVIADLEKATGKKVKPRTLTVIVNPDTRTADVYIFDGLHDRIGWNSDMAKAAYQGTVKYG